MKMNYQHIRPTANSKRNKRTAKIVAGVAVVLIFFRLVTPHFFSAIFVSVFSPLWRLENFVTHSSAITPYNQIIFSENSSNSSDSSFASSTIAMLLQENADLKNMLGRPIGAQTQGQNSSQNSLLAVVLSKPPFSAYDNIIVDVGSSAGVKIGDRVYALAVPVTASTSTISTIASTSMTVSTSTLEIPIGQVSETYDDSSVVSLFSSPGQKYPVEIGPTKILAEATASGAGMFQAMLPHDSNVNVGDAIVIPSIQTSIFASVVSVVSDPARPYSVVIFQSPVNPLSLYFVEIDISSTTLMLKNHAEK